jgi:hypothetical protein
VRSPACPVGDRGGCRWPVDALTAEEVVLDELEVGVEAEGLVVDEPAAGVGADDDARDPQPVAVAVHGRGET